MDVSIIIVNYNTKQMTLNCINSVFERTTGLEFEVILIDNGSTDGSRELFIKDPRIQYVYSYENMGFGRANNVGMMISKGQYIFLLNSDTILVNNAISIFYQYAISHEQAFFGCWLVNSNGSHIHSGGRIPTIGSILFDMCKSYIPGRYEGDRALSYSSNDCLEVGYVTGADLFFNRSVYERTVGFDHMFFMYYEESDWQRRAKKQGIKSYIIQGPKIIHFAGGSQMEKNNRISLGKIQRIIHSRNYYIKKEYSYFVYLIYRICSVILLTPKLIFGRSMNSKDILKGILTLIKG